MERWLRVKKLTLFNVSYHQRSSSLSPLTEHPGHLPVLPLVEAVSNSIPGLLLVLYSPQGLLSGLDLHGKKEDLVQVYHLSSPRSLTAEIRQGRSQSQSGSDQVWERKTVGGVPYCVCVCFILAVLLWCTCKSPAEMIISGHVQLVVMSTQPEPPISCVCVQPDSRNNRCAGVWSSSSSLLVHYIAKLSSCVKQPIRQHCVCVGGRGMFTCGSSIVVSIYWSSNSIFQKFHT